jgi:radical SAM protein with 4Fe4S-binding SPASM domain
MCKRHHARRYSRFNLWTQSEAPISIAPLDQYTQDAIAFINNKKDLYYNKALDESVFLIDIDGSMSGYESYMSSSRYGNIFEQPFEAILTSESRERLVADAVRRIDRHCSGCEFYGACSGLPVAEANPMEQQWLDSSGCYVAKILAHIAERLTTSGLGLLPSRQHGVMEPHLR